MKNPKPISVRVVAQFPWTAIKEIVRPYIAGTYTHLDLWEWNLFKMKWVPMAKANGFGDLAIASRIAKERSDEIEQMLANNRNPPPAL